MIHIQEPFLRQISVRLQNFKSKGNHTYNFRCPICGDSEKSKTKARGYMFPYKGNLVYKCHNCETSMSFSNFLKQEFPDEYKRYMMESISTTGTWGSSYSNNTLDFESGNDFILDNKNKNKISEKTFTNSTQTEGFSAKNAQKLDNLSSQHPFRRYVENRYLKNFIDLYYTHDFRELVAEFDNEYAQKIPRSERIVIPIYDWNGELKGIQGRSLSIREQAKYLTVKFDESFPKIWGLHRLPRDTSTVYVFEGVFDACFFENGVAMLGSDIDHSTIKRYTHCDDVVYVLDNEPRSKQTINKTKNLISKGRPVVIWPNDVSVKDINDSVLEYGLEKTRLMIYENTYRDSLMANLKFEQWRKLKYDR